MRPSWRCACTALEVADGRLPGPYSDAQALAYEHAAAAKAQLSSITRSTVAIFFSAWQGSLIADPVPGLWKPEDGKEPISMYIERAVDEAAHASDARLRKSYEVALVHGATNTACRPDEERLYGPLRLITLAILRLPDLAMIAQLMHMGDEDPVVLRVAREVAGGALRLAHRAPETHGRDVRYGIDAALLTATVELARDHDELAVVIEQVRLATLALTQAAAAIPEDRMLVPDRLAKSLGICSWCM
jgi:hypothetical protein